MLNKFQSDILFTGYYGEKNTGDDAFVEVAAWGAKKYWNKDNSIFLAKEENLPKVLSSIRGYPFSFPKTTFIQNKLLISSANYLISAGGSTLFSKFHPRDIKSLALEEKRKRKNIKLGAIGVSIGPFKTIEDEKIIKNYLKNLSFLSVRDQTSFDYLKSLDLPYSPVNAFDLAALLPKIYEVDAKPKLGQSKDKKVVGVSVCPVESISGDNINLENIRNKKIIELLKILNKNKDIHFKFFVINGNDRVGDYNLSCEIINQVSPFNYDLVNYNKYTRSIWEEIQQCDFIISTRLHAAIFACFSDIPFMLNEYHRKCSDFLDNVGYNYHYRLFNNEYDVVEKAETILNILNGRVNYVMPTKIKEMEEMAELNFTGVEI